MVGFVIEFKVETGAGFFTDKVKAEGGVLVFPTEALAKTYIRVRMRTDRQPSAVVRPVTLTFQS